MNRELDLSVGQRLAVGFLALLVILAAFVVVVARSHQQSAAAQATFADVLAPRLQAASVVERELLYAGIVVRRSLLNPDAASRERVSLKLSQIRQAVDTLTLRASGDDQREIAARISAATEHYIGEALELVALAATGRDAAREAALDATRERALGIVRQFASEQDERAAAALATMSDTRAQAQRGVNLASLVVLVGLGLVAAWTAQSVRRPTRQLVEIAGALEAGNWAPALAWAPTGDAPSRPVRSEWRRVAHAFGAAARELDRREQRLRATAAVSAAASSSLDRDEVAAATLRAVVDHVGAELGVVYWVEGDTLQPVARFAIDGQATPLALGDGLPGQAARDGHRTMARDIPEDSGFKVRLGYDEAPPRHVVAVPAMFRGSVQGVLLVGSLREFAPDALTFLDATGTQLGVALQNLRAHEEIQALLAEVRGQAERIQAQNEELQAQNEELQAQNEEIQTQNEEIQTQREELEAQYEQLAERGIALRTQAQLLSDADARKNEFLGWLAHELRNPMAPITTSLHVLREVEPGSDAARRALAVIERQSRHLVRLIDDLLDITRISHGKIDVRRERVDLIDIVRASAEDQHDAIAARGLRLEFDTLDAPLWVDGDRTRLAQVLGNVFSNAIKFTDAGGTISVTVRGDVASGYATLSVRDTGTGIDPSLLPRLFRPFSQGPATLARTRGGLGLGLALVKALVDLHGGTVQARSDGPGTGTEIVVRLPLADRPQRNEPADGRPASRRVLIIEDNVDAAQSLQSALELAGQVVDVAFTAADGLDRALRHVPDVIICDIGLPGMNGYELARRVRAEPRLRNTVLVALTGYAAPRDRAQAASAGFDRHLSKPPSVADVLALLSDCVEAESAEAEGEAVLGSGETGENGAS